MPGIGVGRLAYFSHVGRRLSRQIRPMFSVVYNVLLYGHYR